MPNVELTDRARTLRVGATEVERQLWGRLRDRRLGGWKWRRQAPQRPFIVDFYCVEANLAVELDGGQHVDRAAYDAQRTALLGASGLRVLRFWNPEVLENMEGVCWTILSACGGERRPSPYPLPGGERGAITRVPIASPTSPPEPLSPTGRG